MATRINASELERLIADDTVSDETIAKYLKPAAMRGLPFEPTLTFNDATVDAPSTRGIIGLTVSALNARANRRRVAAYQARIAGGWKGLKILAEGDSWFLYPILLRDIVDNLSTDYAIYSVAAAGDTLENMVRGAAHLEELIDANGFDAMLLSAGGNDIAGDALKSYLREVPGPARAPDAYITEKFDEFLATAKARMGGVVMRLTKRFQHLQVFGHGYDWPFPHGGGVWLEPAFGDCNIPAAVRGPVLKVMIDRYYAMLRDIAAQSNGRYHLVDCRGAVGASQEWFDELHPFDAGFARASDRFRDEISRVFGIARSRAAAPLQATIIWRPQGETTGARMRSREFPQGAMITIGRGSDREIILDDDRVSRNHARLIVVANGVDVEDVGSSNGTILDGRKINKARWRPGQNLQIGHYAFALEFAARAAAVPPEAVTKSAPKEDAPSRSGPGDGAPSGPIPVVGAAAAVLKSQPAAEPASEPASGDLAATPPALAPRVAKRQIEIVLSSDSITAQETPAWAIGLFEGVNPLAIRGTARAIDEHLEGVLSDVLQSRMVEGHLGSVLPLPVASQRGAVRNLLLVGLGAIMEFAPKSIETAGENVARMLVATRVFSLATVPIGVNTGMAVKQSIVSFLTGFLRGLQKSDEDRGFRSLTLCELKPDRYGEMKRQVQDLQGGDFFAAAGFDVTLAVREPAAAQHPVEVPGDAAAIAPRPEKYAHKIYIEVANKVGSTFEYGLLGLPGASLPFFAGPAVVSDRLKGVLASPSCPRFDLALGTELAEAFMPSKMQHVLGQELTSAPGHLVIIHDGASAAVPWEAAFIDGKSLALGVGVSRKHRSETRSMPAKRPQRAAPPSDGRLRMLLIFDPTCDLKGTETEAHDLIELFNKKNCSIKALKREECTKEAILAELRGATYDLLHFAGHGMFTRQDPENSGIVLAGGKVFCASDLEGLPAVPRLIVLNACQSGRVRSQVDVPADAGAGNGPTGHASLAEGFILRNIAHFIGTFWQVGDEAAHRFAITFYSELLTGAPVSLAVLTARQALEKNGEIDWVSYLHFGEPGETLGRSW